MVLPVNRWYSKFSKCTTLLAINRNLATGCMQGEIRQGHAETDGNHISPCVELHTARDNFGEDEFSGVVPRSVPAA